MYKNIEIFTMPLFQRLHLFMGAQLKFLPTFLFYFTASNNYLFFLLKRNKQKQPGKNSVTKSAGEEQDLGRILSINILMYACCL